MLLTLRLRRTRQVRSRPGLAAGAGRNRHSRHSAWLQPVFQPAPRLTSLGWTIFEDVYLFNGTWFIVTDKPSDVPLIRLMASTGAEIWNDEGSIKNR